MGDRWTLHEGDFFGPGGELERFERAQREEWQRRIDRLKTRATLTGRKVTREEIMEAGRQAGKIVLQRMYPQQGTVAVHIDSLRETRRQR